MATTADFRNGLCIVFKDDFYRIVQFQHVKPGKGPAFVRTKMQNIKTGRTLENTFTSGEKKYENNADIAAQQSIEIGNVFNMV